MDVLCLCIGKKQLCHESKTMGFGARNRLIRRKDVGVSGEKLLVDALGSRYGTSRA